MGLVSLEDYMQYKQMVYILFLLIGIIGFFIYFWRDRLGTMPNTIAVFLFLLSIIVIGAYPIVNLGEDRFRYYELAQEVMRTGQNLWARDVGYFYVIRILTLFPFSLYFYLHGFLYVIGIYIFCKYSSKDNYGLLFLGCILNFQFIAYGVNGMRAGLAQSMLMIAMANRNKIRWEILFIFISISIHKSFALPAVCYLITKHYDRTKLYFYIWLLAIPVSAIFGESIQAFFSTFMSNEERMAYFSTTASETSYNVGFRLDFILFSCAPIIIGYYYIYKRNYKDVIYKNLYNMYLLANTFWILVIRADYSDRFAYLSWFIYTIVLLYPLANCSQIVPKSNKWVAVILLGLTLFKAFQGW